MMEAAASEHDQPDRRRSIRFPLGLPVRVRLAGNVHAMTVELMDLSADGGRFRCATETVQVDQGASFAFVLPGQRHCLARGSVVRATASGEFALRLHGSNAEFRGFIGQLTA
jgi:PilZ domain